MADPLFVVQGPDPFERVGVIGQLVPIGEKFSYTLERTATEIIVTVTRTTANGVITGSARTRVRTVTAPYETNTFGRIPTSHPPDAEPPPPPPPDDPPDIENWQPFAGTFVQNADGSVTVTSDGTQTYVTLQSDDNYIPKSNLTPTRVFTGTVRVKAANAAATGKTAYLIYRQRNADNSTDTNDGDATAVLTTSYQTITSEFTSSVDDRPMDLRLSLRGITSGAAFTVEALPTSTYEEIDDPDPPPTGETVYDRPFVNSPLYRKAKGVGTDAQSATMVNVFLNACASANSGRGPTVFFGEQRFESDSSDPLWTIRGNSVGGSTTIRAPQNLSDQGGADPTIGIYDDTNLKIVRLYGGASNPIDFDYTNHVAAGSNLGVDTNLDGVPNQGIGTAWGRMSGEGVLTAQDATTVQHRVKFALGNNYNARSFREPAKSFEQQAYGPAYPNGVPAGVTFVHLYTQAEILQAVNACFGTTPSARRTFAIAFWEGLSYDRGYGAVNGDGTGAGGINFYINYTELGLSSTDARSAVRLPLSNNTGARRTVLYDDRTKWRALVAG